jgi:hypothetical protein
MASAINLWGLAIMVCLTVILGFIWHNSRLTDLRGYVEARFDAIDRRFDDMNKRLDDMNKGFGAIHSGAETMR